MSNKVYFVFPSKSDSPTGGYKIAFQYADFLAENGYDVTLILPFSKLSFPKDLSLFLTIKTFIGFYYRLLRKQISSANWYDFKNKINKKYIFHLNFLHLHFYSKKSIFFATSVETSYEVIKLNKNINKYYLIQGFELWNNNTEEYLFNSYKLGFHNIVISNWLKEKVDSTGATSTLIYNGFDFNYFYIQNEIKNRNKYEISMLYHINDKKRCIDAITALRKVKIKIPQLHVTMFGIPERPENLETWFSYYQKPDKKDHNSVYNNSAIYVAASSEEGWGLTIGEAMICGCAVACTNNDGFKIMAHDNETALLSPVYDTDTLAANIIRLIEDDDLRIRLATNGNNYIKQFTQEKANNQLLNLITKNIIN